MANPPRQNYGWSESLIGNDQVLVPGVAEGGQLGYPSAPPNTVISPLPYPLAGFTPGSELPSALNCPVCQDNLVPPIYQCSKGHVLCNRCIDSLDYCISQPECLDPLDGLKLRNFTLEQSLFHVQMNCPHPGCLTQISGGAMANHLEVCEFRPLPFCSEFFGFNCSAACSATSLLPHLRDCHQVEETELDKFTLNLTASHRLDSPFGLDLVWNCVLITSSTLDDNPVLLKCFTAPNGNICLTGYLLPTTTNTSCNQYRIKFQINSISNGSRLEWTGRLISHYPNEPIDPTIAPSQNLNSFRVPLNLLSDCIENSDESSKLTVNAFVSKLPTNEQNDEDEDALYLEKLKLYPTQLSFDQTLSQNDLQLRCAHCSSLLIARVIYQCLQCPSDTSATYFCPGCIHEGHHDTHLTIRIPNKDLQPLAAVAYECCVGELR